MIIGQAYVSKSLLFFFVVAVRIYSPAISFSTGAPISKCDETIIIDDIEYPVPVRWCGKKLDKSLLANSKKLAKLPSEISHEGFKIYVSPETRKALVKMSDAAREKGIYLIVDSGFRSIWYQKLIIKRRLLQGEKYEKLITFVAPPGYSEHHTARAIDFVPSEARFAFTDTYKWLKEHADEFGFYETYPEDTTGATPWESWHWVYQPN